MAAKGWEAYETIGIGIPNPRGVIVVPIPKDLPPEELARIEAEIDRINAELEAQLKAEEASLAAADQEKLGKPSS